MIYMRLLFRLLFFLKPAFDFLVVPLILVLAYSLKFKVGWTLHHVFLLDLGQIYDSAQIEPYLKLAFPVSFIWIVTFYFSGLYKSYVGAMPIIDELIQVIKSITLATLQVMALTFVVRTLPDSRYVVGYTWVLGICVIGASRVAFWRLELIGFKYSFGQKRAIVMGADPLGQDVAERMVLYPSYRYRYLGTIDAKQPSQIHYHLREHFSYLGTPSKKEALLAFYRPQVVFLTDPSFDRAERKSLYEICERLGIELHVISNVSLFNLGKVVIDDFDGVPFISSVKPQFSIIHIWLKRLMDIVVALFLLVMLSPVFCIIACLIKWHSKGPVIYKQTRLTQNERPFEMLKFRTMVMDAEKHSGPVMVNIQNESRYIPYGQFLRKLSLDELPQLINVLKGDMSLVGPRPERPHFVNEFKKEVPHYALRTQMKAGLTGWAQVNGRSFLTDKPEHKLKYDLYYIHNWSLVLDLKILVKTVSVILHREEAY